MFEELDKDRAVYDNVSTSDFIETFSVGDDIVEKFQDFLNLKERTNISFVNYNDQMKMLIKAELASQLYSTNASEQIINATDAMIEEVILLSKANETLNE